MKKFLLSGLLGLSICSVFCGSANAGVKTTAPAFILQQQFSVGSSNDVIPIPTSLPSVATPACPIACPEFAVAAGATQVLYAPARLDFLSQFIQDRVKKTEAKFKEELKLKALDCVFEADFSPLAQAYVNAFTQICAWLFNKNSAKTAGIKGGMICPLVQPADPVAKSALLGAPCLLFNLPAIQKAIAAASLGGQTDLTALGVPALNIGIDAYQLMYDYNAFVADRIRGKSDN